MISEEHVAGARQVYDAAAADYVAFVGTELSDKTEDAVDRSVLEAFGIDVSPRLARIAHDAHPTIPFATGQISALPLADRCLGGGVCWYSIIYTPPEELGRAFVEIGRVVSPGGLLLLAFQAGPAKPIHRIDAFGSGHPLTSYRHDPDDVGADLEAAGFTVHATTVRAPARDHEDSPQAFVLAHC